MYVLGPGLTPAMEILCSKIKKKRTFVKAQEQLFLFRTLRLSPAIIRQADLHDLNRDSLLTLHAYYKVLWKPYDVMKVCWKLDHLYLWLSCMLL